MGALVDKKGLRDWCLQRVSALLIGAYALFLMVYSMTETPLTYLAWHHLFSSTLMRTATILVMLSLLVHAWIGLWTVLTDYVHAKILRLSLEITLMGLLIVYFVVLLDILWR